MDWAQPRTQEKEKPGNEVSTTCEIIGFYSQKCFKACLILTFLENWCGNFFSVYKNQQNCSMNLKKFTHVSILRTVPPFATAHTFCASQDGLMSISFPEPLTDPSLPLSCFPFSWTRVTRALGTRLASISKVFLRGLWLCGKKILPRAV